MYDYNLRAKGVLSCEWTRTILSSYFVVDIHVSVRQGQFVRSCMGQSSVSIFGIGSHPITAFFILKAEDEDLVVPFEVFSRARIF